MAATLATHLLLLGSHLKPQSSGAFANRRSLDRPYTVGEMRREDMGQREALRVCTVLDAGFDELTKESEGMSIADITSDSSLQGFGVEARRAVLTGNGLNYTMRVYSSYAAVHIAVRARECDIAWVALFVTGSRNRCYLRVMHSSTGSAECQDMSLLPQDQEGVDLTPWRCCIDYLAPFHMFGNAVMYSSPSRSFFEALFLALGASFVVNMLSFMFILAVVFSHLVWFAERKRNGQFSAKYLYGIDDAVWWAPPKPAP